VAICKKVTSMLLSLAHGQTPRKRFSSLPTRNSVTIEGQACVSPLVLVDYIIYLWTLQAMDAFRQRNFLNKKTFLAEDRYSDKYVSVEQISRTLKHTLYFGG
jgi:hypothetical protein